MNHELKLRISLLFINDDDSLFFCCQVENDKGSKPSIPSLTSTHPPTTPLTHPPPPITSNITTPLSLASLPSTQPAPSLPLSPPMPVLSAMPLPRQSIQSQVRII